MNVKSLRLEIEGISDFSEILEKFESGLKVNDSKITKIRSIFVSLNSIKDVVDMLDVLSYNLGVIVIKKFKKEDDRVSKMLAKMKEDEISFSSVKKGLKDYFKSVSDLEKLVKVDVSVFTQYGKKLEKIANLLEKDFEEIS